MGEQALDKGKNMSSTFILIMLAFWRHMNAHIPAHTQHLIFHIHFQREQSVVMPSKNGTIPKNNHKIYSLWNLWFTAFLQNNHGGY